MNVRPLDRVLRPNPTISCNREVYKSWYILEEPL